MRQVKMRLNAETGRADRAERGQLRSDAELAFTKHAFED